MMITKRTRAKSKFKLGDFVQDVVSGFSGTVTARCEYLYITDSYLVSPRYDGNGFPEGKWLEAKQLKKFKASKKIRK